MNKGLIFFLGVMALYAFLILRGIVRAVRARFEKMSERKYAKAQTIPREKWTPYRKPLINLDPMVRFLAEREEELSGENKNDN